jgi:hypothetical protein
MITHLQITFPQHPGHAFPIAASNGLTLPVRARSDVRKGKVYPLRILTRAEWDDQNKPAGPYLAVYQPMRPVPDVDFEAEDGSLWPTAEACLEHELEVRFGVKTLAEVEAQMKAIADKAKLTVGEVAEALASPAEPAFDTEAALYDANGNPPFSGVPECQPAKRPGGAVCDPRFNNGVPQEDCARLLASAVSQRGLKIAEAARATGLTPAQVRATAKSLPGQFATNGGRVFLVE